MQLIAHGSLCNFSSYKCLLCGNHADMGTPSSYFCWISCELLCMLILAEVRVIFPWVAYGWSMHIVREEHWAANQSHAYMVEVSAWTLKSSISYENIIIVECLKHKRGVHYLFSMLSRYGRPSWDLSNARNPMRSFSLDLCTGGMEVPLCDTWLKHMYVMKIHGSPS